KSMTKKKTQTPVKKAATKKSTAKPEMEWKQTSEAYVPGIGTVKHFAVKFDEDTKPSAQDILDAVTAENHALKTLLSKHQSEPMPQTQGMQSAPQPVTMLEQFHYAMEAQQDRLQACIYRLDGIAQKLQSTQEQADKTSDQGAYDISTRLSNAIGIFSSQNNQLEALLEKLSKLI
ncbi:MAG TPA: hypothetical protein VN922_08005, partial [Bacteroidia bacterium]|nr:hypothetical protein [Bacteroidia bacterium]